MLGSLMFNKSSAHSLTSQHALTSDDAFPFASASPFDVDVDDDDNDNDRLVVWIFIPSVSDELYRSASTGAASSSFLRRPE